MNIPGQYRVHTLLPRARAKAHGLRRTGMRIIAPALTALALCSSFVAPATAQTTAYPGLKAVSLVVPYPAGGASDASARILSGPIGEALGQQVIVENVGGGTGILGAMRVLNASADGYTMLHGSPNEVILSPLLNTAAKYTPEDFRLTQQISEATLVLLARSGLEANTLDEFVEMVRRPDSTLTYGSVGVGSLYHVIGEYMAQRIGAKFLHVPYKGAAPVMQDLVGGQIDFAILPYQTSMDAMSKAGRIKMITSFSKTLPPMLRHIPTLQESKLLPDFEYAIGGGYFVPKNTPADVVDRLRVAVGKAIELPEVRARLEAEGRTVVSAGSQEQADAYYAKQIAQYREMVTALGLTPQ